MLLSILSAFQARLPASNNKCARANKASHYKNLLGYISVFWYLMTPKKIDTTILLNTYFWISVSKLFGCVIISHRSFAYLWQFSSVFALGAVPLTLLLRLSSPHCGRLADSEVCLWQSTCKCAEIRRGSHPINREQAIHAHCSSYLTLRTLCLCISALFCLIIIYM